MMEDRTTSFRRALFALIRQSMRRANGTTAENNSVNTLQIVPEPAHTRSVLGTALKTARSVCIRSSDGLGGLAFGESGGEASNDSKQLRSPWPATLRPADSPPSAHVVELSREAESTGPGGRATPSDYHVPPAHLSGHPRRHGRFIPGCGAPPSRPRYWVLGTRYSAVARAR